MRSLRGMYVLGSKVTPGKKSSESMSRVILESYLYLAVCCASRLSRTSMLIHIS